MSASYGELLLVIGDLHSGELPAKLKALLVPDKMLRSLVTGNIGASMDFLRRITPQVNVVAGDMDDEAYPEELVVDLGEFKVGLIHGHQVVPWGDKNALGAVARRLGVDILISGHTHEYSCTEHDGVWLINPGSASGYYSPLCSASRPTFICMSVVGSVITNYVYILDTETGEVIVKKDRLVKSAEEPEKPARPAAPPASSQNEEIPVSSPEVGREAEDAGGASVAAGEETDPVETSRIEQEGGAAEEQSFDA